MKIRNMILICTLLSYSGAAIDMRNWNAAKIFSYKEIKAATNNFKEVIGRGCLCYMHSAFSGTIPVSYWGAESVSTRHFVTQTRHFRSPYLAASDDVEVLSQDINKLAFPFIAPLRP